MSLLTLPIREPREPTTSHHPTIDHKVAERLRRSSYWCTPRHLVVRQATASSA